MFKFEFLQKLSKSSFLSLGQPVATRVLLAFCLLLLLVFADTAIPLINNIIQLKIDLLGLFLEPLLQSMFDIPLRQAQVLASWIYLLIGVFIVWYVFKKVYQTLFDVFYKLRQNWLEKNRIQKIRFSLLILLLLVALAKIILLFV